MSFSSTSLLYIYITICRIHEFYLQNNFNSMRINEQTVRSDQKALKTINAAVMVSISNYAQRKSYYFVLYTADIVRVIGIFAILFVLRMRLNWTEVFIELCLCDNRLDVWRQERCGTHILERDQTNCKWGDDVTQCCRSPLYAHLDMLQR